MIVEILEDVTDCTREQLRQKENYIIRKYKGDPYCLNVRNAYDIREKVMCGCGETLLKVNLKCHMNTNRHTRNILKVLPCC
jgi:hypothetical protein